MNGFELVSREIEEDRLRREGVLVYVVKNFFTALHCRQKELAKENKACEIIDEIIKNESRNYRLMLAEIGQLNLDADGMQRLMAHNTQQVLRHT